MSPWERLRERPQPPAHFVQICEASGRVFLHTAGFYLWPGLRPGDGLLIVATAEHRQLLAAHLAGFGADVPQSVRDGRIRVPRLPGPVPPTGNGSSVFALWLRGHRPAQAQAVLSSGSRSLPASVCAGRLKLRSVVVQPPSAIFPVDTNLQMRLE